MAALREMEKKAMRSKVALPTVSQGVNTYDTHIRQFVQEQKNSG